MDFTAVGKQPIPGDKPAGIDIRYDSDFESLQAEIDKLSSPTASGQVDWNTIVKSAGTILSEKSKDLTVASYLAVGLLITRQIDGLALGIVVFKDLVENFWDDLYPPKKRMRGRVGSLTWWMERSEIEFKKIQLKPLPEATVQEMLANIKKLSEDLNEKLPESLSLRTVQRLVESIPVIKVAAKPAVPKETAAAASTPADSKPAPASAAAPAEASDAMGNVQDARKGVDSSLQKIRQASFLFLQNDLKDPMAYRYRRMASWIKIQALPPNTDGATKIQPPAPQLIEPLIQLKDEGNWPALIQNAEQKLSQFVFWFDLNRFVAEGLSDLGAEYQKALSAVCQETAYFIARLPGAEKLAFADGTPFADPETRKWLQTITFAEASAAAPSAGAAGGAEDDYFSKTLQKAKTQARKKNLTDAIGLLQKEMQQTHSRQKQMRWRLAIAQVLLNAKKTTQALPHLDQLLADIDEFRLDVWDPPLALEGLLAAWEGYSSQTANEHKLRAAELIARIAKIYPAEAIKIQK